jgi:hypothetical protein
LDINHLSIKIKSIKYIQEDNCGRYLPISSK